jgi:hypothetical protein
MHHLLELIKAQLLNPFVSGGLIITLTAAIVAFARNLPNRIIHRVTDQFIVSVAVFNNDPLFDWITLWLNDQPYSQKTRRLFASTIPDYGEGASCYSRGDAPAQVPSSSTEEEKRPKLILSPAKGQHFFRYKKTILWLSRDDGGTPESSGNKSLNSGNNFRFQRESYNLRIFGRKQTVLRQVLNDAIDRAMAFQAKKISAFVGVYGGWRRLRTFTPRTMASVILPDGLSEAIIQRLRDFVADRAWYQQMGIPYHLGMLFYGIPGSGKTSMIAALAGELKMNLYILSLASEEMNDERFACLLSEIPPSSFMVLEDVDAAFGARSRKTENSDRPTSGLTLTGILNALDGFMASEGAIVLMTTNHKELLDPALVRPGRVDVEVEFGRATQSQLRRLYQRFFPKSNGDAEIWAITMEGKTMAEAQQNLLQLKKERKLTDAKSVNNRITDLAHA